MKALSTIKAGEPCPIEGCVRLVKAAGMCGMHYQRVAKWGDPHKTLTRYGVEITGYPQKGWGPGTKHVHTIIAEKALGRPLPPEAVVHHLDGTKSNHRGNLAIFPNQSYHALIHQRMVAKKACGNPDWRSCMYCHQYDDVDNMKKHGNGRFHVSCYNKYQRDRRKRRREFR